jgi:hypothetical protein
MIDWQNDPASHTGRGATGAPARPPGDAAPEGAPQKRRQVYVPLGRVLATPGALRTLAVAGADGAVYLARHAAGDWGDVDAHDWAANDRALLADERLLSAYVLPNGERLWIITEADRSASTLLLPDEY